MLQVQHHAGMLRISSRLDAYRRALSAVVQPHDRVVDLGTGTGILASYAALLTDAPVLALEYFPDTAEVASRLGRVP
jgi:type I protein arginine methyltransferase